jgi:hypothetical protein
MAKGRHRAVRVKQKLFWWQRKRLISMRVQAWLLVIQEFKFELREIMMELRKNTNKEKNGR